MIGIEELEKRINEILKIFKKRTKFIACSVLDKDGFIIATLKDGFIEDDLYNKKIIALYTAIESLSEKGIELIDFHKKRELISIGVVDEFFNNGIMILIKSVGDTIIFLTIFPILLNKKPIFMEFDKVIEELSIYFLDPEYKESWKDIYKMV